MNYFINVMLLHLITLINSFELDKTLKSSIYLLMFI